MDNMSNHEIYILGWVTGRVEGVTGLRCNLANPDSCAFFFTDFAESVIKHSSFPLSMCNMTKVRIIALPCLTNAKFCVIIYPWMRKSALMR